MVKQPKPVGETTDIQSDSAAVTTVEDSEPELVPVELVREPTPVTTVGDLPRDEEDRVLKSPGPMAHATDGDYSAPVFKKRRGGGSSDLRRDLPKLRSDAAAAVEASFLLKWFN